MRTVVMIPSRGDGGDDNSSGGVDGTEIMVMLERAGLAMTTAVMVAMVVAAG